MLREQNQPLRTGTLIPFADGRRKILAIRSIVNIWFHRSVRNRGLSTEIKQPVNRSLPYTAAFLCAVQHRAWQVRLP